MRETPDEEPNFSIADRMDATEKRYRSSEKGKDAQKRYLSSKKGRNSQRIYLNSEKGLAAQLRYRLSEKGMSTTQKRQQLAKLADQAITFLEENPDKTVEDYLLTLEIQDETHT